MSANLITGNLFKPIYAYQDADYQAGISGNVTSIMPVGSQMALSIEDANTIKADDGVLITKEGRRIQIDAGAIEEWSIPTGTQGAINYFIIGFHLYTDSNSAEVCETFVEQMENSTDTIPEDTFREGSTEVYVSLGRVVQNGINLDSVTSLVQIAQSFEDVRNAIAQLNSDLADKNVIKEMKADTFISIGIPYDKFSLWYIVAGESGGYGGLDGSPYLELFLTVSGGTIYTVSLLRETSSVVSAFSYGNNGRFEISFNNSLRYRTLLAIPIC
jgi:hypothetical protein